MLKYLNYLCICIFRDTFLFMILSNSFILRINSFKTDSNNSRVTVKVLFILQSQSHNQNTPSASQSHIAMLTVSQQSDLEVL